MGRPRFLQPAAHAFAEVRSRWRRIRGELRRAHAAGGWSAVTLMTARRTRYAALRALGKGQTEDEIARESMEYWNCGDACAGVDLKDYSHWQGAGPWADRGRWLKLGRVHRKMFERLCAATGTPRPVRRIVEWGSGGGANAIHFVGEMQEFCGVEISQANLDECGRVLRDAGFDGYRPVLISAETPEQALESAGMGYDLFLSAYVFELLPGKFYAERVLRIGHAMLRDGGLALVQIRYDDGTERSTQKTIDYYRNSTRFTSFRVEEFWLLAERLGFSPEYVTLVPRRTEDYSGDLYAYFALRKS